MLRSTKCSKLRNRKILHAGNLLNSFKPLYIVIPCHFSDIVGVGSPLHLSDRVSELSFFPNPCLILSTNFNVYDNNLCITFKTFNTLTSKLLLVYLPQLKTKRSALYIITDEVLGCILGSIKK